MGHVEGQIPSVGFLILRGIPSTKWNSLCSNTACSRKWLFYPLNKYKIWTSKDTVDQWELQKSGSEGNIQVTWVQWMDFGRLPWCIASSTLYTAAYGLLWSRWLFVRCRNFRLTVTVTFFLLFLPMILSASSRVMLPKLSPLNSAISSPLLNIPQAGPPSDTSTTWMGKSP